MLAVACALIRLVIGFSELKTGEEDVSVKVGDCTSWREGKFEANWLSYSCWVKFEAKFRGLLCEVLFRDERIGDTGTGSYKPLRNYIDES